MVVASKKVAQGCKEAISYFCSCKNISSSFFWWPSHTHTAKKRYSRLKIAWSTLQCCCWFVGSFCRSNWIQQGGSRACTISAAAYLATSTCEKSHENNGSTHLQEIPTYYNIYVIQKTGSSHLLHNEKSWLIYDFPFHIIFSREEKILVFQLNNLHFCSEW